MRRSRLVRSSDNDAVVLPSGARDLGATYVRAAIVSVCRTGGVLAFGRGNLVRRPAADPVPRVPLPDAIGGRSPAWERSGRSAGWPRAGDRGRRGGDRRRQDPWHSVYELPGQKTRHHLLLAALTKKPHRPSEDANQLKRPLDKVPPSQPDAYPGDLSTHLACADIGYPGRSAWMWLSGVAQCHLDLGG